MKEKCKFCDNNWEKNQKTVVLQIGLLSIFIVLEVYSPYINRRHCSKIQSKSISWGSRQISWNNINLMFSSDCFLSLVFAFFICFYSVTCDPSMSVLFCILRQSQLYTTEKSSHTNWRLKWNAEKRKYQFDPRTFF